MEKRDIRQSGKVEEGECNCQGPIQFAGKEQGCAVKVVDGVESDPGDLPTQFTIFFGVPRSAVCM